MLLTTSASWAAEPDWPPPLEGAVHGTVTLTTPAFLAVPEAAAADRFVYYLPGAHGQSYRHGTPVVQYEVATGTRKVQAFLLPPFETANGYSPGGTYGIKLSGDGGTLYVNVNGNAADGVRPAHAKAKGFGRTAFAATATPASER